jgi:hypothetical protein
MQPLFTENEQMDTTKDGHANHKNTQIHTGRQPMTTTRRIAAMISAKIN